MSAAEAYLKKCMDECGDKLADPHFFGGDKLQSNAIRGEPLRDMSPRCGLKMPEHWHEDTKSRGWGIWIYSGGTAEVFGRCVYQDCPLRDFFLRHAPRKAIRNQAKSKG